LWPSGCRWAKIEICSNEQKKIEMPREKSKSRLPAVEDRSAIGPESGVDWIGYRWLASHYNVTPVQPFRKVSCIGGSRREVVHDGISRTTWIEAARPAPTLAGHLTFALKHEGVHLEFLTRLLRVIDPEVLVQWITAEPTGQYARRAGFFYEWLTGQRLEVADTAAGGYVEALDPAQYWTASQVSNNARWRVKDNLPGSPSFCPLVWLALAGTAQTYDCKTALAALDARFDPSLLQRSAVWLSLRESQASFAIERETQHTSRVQRFAQVLEQECGRGDSALSDQRLEYLQRAILGDKALHVGIRQSPVYIGETRSFLQQVHYLAPPPEQVHTMLQGLDQTDRRTRGSAALIRAAVLSFGFVYIHPMADGNGRISRFLIQDVLRRDGAVPAPFVLPISVTITDSVVRRHSYDEVLERYSKPFMQQYSDQWHFGPKQIAADGVAWNLYFDAADDALPTWRYPDLTDHVAWLADVVQVTLEHELPKEAAVMRSWARARAQVKEVLEGPDHDIDRIVRSVREQGGKLSGKLRKEFVQLEDDALAAAVVEAVQSAWVD